MQNIDKMQEIKDQLRKIFAKALKSSNLEANDIGDTNLVSTLGLDSISSLEILIWIEDEFKITIEDQDLSSTLVDSLDTLAGYIKRRMQASAGSEGQGVAETNPVLS